MISDITIGQYFPGTSLLHKLDPRVKIILSILFIVAIFMCHYIFTFALIILFTIFLISVSGIKVKTILKSIKPILIILVITSLINIFLTDGEHLIWEWKFLHIYEEGLYRALCMCVRVTILIVATSLFLSYTTSPIELTDALESLLSPLRIFHIPVHEFAMMMTIALRFIPTLLEETERIMNAQKSRGADFTTGSLIQRINAFIPIIIPLFVSAFQRAVDLATAMECRCYRGGDGRTKYKEYHVGARDIIMLFVFALLITLIVIGNQQFVIDFIGWGYSV